MLREIKAIKSSFSHLSQPSCSCHAEFVPVKQSARSGKLSTNMKFFFPINLFDRQDFPKFVPDFFTILGKTRFSATGKLVAGNARLCVSLFLRTKYIFEILELTCDVQWK